VGDAVEIVIRQPGHPDRTSRVPDGVTRLGRGDDCEVVLADVGVSRRHAQLVVQGGVVRVEDLNSGNGTWTRGERVERATLRDGDEFVIDPFVVQVRIRAGRTHQDPTPQLQPRARLDVVSGPGLAHSTYPIPARGLTLGRGETRDVVIPDPACSRHHCSVFFQQGQYVLKDMGSANGIFVNGERVEERVLQSGDVLTVGNTELRYVLDEATRPGAGATRPARAPSKPPTPKGTDYTALLSMVGTAFFAGALLVVAFLVVLFVKGDPLPTPTTRPSGPPGWTISVEEDGTTDPAALSRSGVALVKVNDHDHALEKFWLVLRAVPGNEAAERFAYAAGERIVLGEVRTEQYRYEAERARRDAERDALITAAEAGDRTARRELERSFRDDTVARTAMGWPPSESLLALQTRVGDAAQHTADRQWSRASAVYREVLAATDDEAIVRTASAGRLLAEKELARETHDAWASAVLAEAQGRAADAITGYDQVLAIDPNNPSARIRKARLAAAR
jgi:pSer/pThr/pTyr-binding forkhead associated (FHA) protein/tetratricopeptide (TPR) repeat protein